jgi:hypothetical protein
LFNVIKMKNVLSIYIYRGEGDGQEMEKVGKQKKEMNLWVDFKFSFYHFLSPLLGHTVGIYKDRSFIISPFSKSNKVFRYQ